MQDTLSAVREALRAAANAHANEVMTPMSIELSIDEEHPVAWLRTRLGLSETEERVLWVLIAHELCPASRRAIRELNSEPQLDPTLDAIRRVVYPRGDRRALRELGEGGALRRFDLIEWIDANVPEHRRTLRVAARVLALVHGEVALDPELAGCATLDATPRAIGELEVAPGVVERVDAAFDAGGLVILHGAAGSGRRSILAALARQRGLRTIEVDCRSLSNDAARAGRELRLVARECSLLACVPLLRNVDEHLDAVEALFDGELVLATASRAPSRRWRRPPSMIALPPLRGSQLAMLWRRALPDANAELLATMYPLAPALVEAVGAIARREAGARPLAPVHIEAGVRAVLDDRLAGLATRIAVTQSWDDLVLPEDQATAVVELLARIRRRRRVYEDWGFGTKLGKGLGVTALFSGPPGTGKTMCAALVARELGTELYQVDVSRISSKWIGESEKNLAALFDAAEAGHAILLFDEADALFGKRTSVKSSNDHHANQQVNFLLQRLESFTGICVLTTNNDAALDEAFRRRLSIHIRFPVPDAEERTKLWQSMLPAAAPVAGTIPFTELARKYVMSGGYIRNAVLRAAFLAADEDQPITAAHLAQAAQREYEAMGKLATAA